MDKWLPTIIQLVIVIVSAAGGWYLLKDQKGKLKADSENVLVGTAKSLVGTLREELDRANEKITTLEAAVKTNQAETDFLRKELSTLKLKTDTELAKMRKRIAELVKGIGILTDQIRSLGHEPAWEDK